MFLADGLLAFGVTTRGAWQTSVRLCLSRQSADAYGKPPMAGAHVSVCVCVHAWKYVHGSVCMCVRGGMYLCGCRRMCQCGFWGAIRRGNVCAKRVHVYSVHIFMSVCVVVYVRVSLSAWACV